MSAVLTDQSSIPEPQPTTKMFLDIPTAAELAGFSVRHFRRIIEEDQIPMSQIGRKFFVLGRDFCNWQASKRTRKYPVRDARAKAKKSA